MKLFSNKFVKNLKPFFKSNFRLLSTTNNYNLQVNFNNKFKKALFNKKNLFSFQKFNCGDKSKPVSDQTISENEALEIVEAGVFEVIKGAAKCNQDKLSRSAEFKDLGFDSLDQVELVVAMEEKFNLNISDDDSLKIQTVLDAIQIMHKAFVETHCNVGTKVEQVSNNQINDKV